jgi:hypothetical protein
LPKAPNFATGTTHGSLNVLPKRLTTLSISIKKTQKSESHSKSFSWIFPPAQEIKNLLLFLSIDKGSSYPFSFHPDRNGEANIKGLYARLAYIQGEKIHKYFTPPA